MNAWERPQLVVPKAAATPPAVGSKPRVVGIKPRVVGSKLSAFKPRLLVLNLVLNPILNMYLGLQTDVGGPEGVAVVVFLGVQRAHAIQEAGTPDDEATRARPADSLGSLIAAKGFGRPS